MIPGEYFIDDGELVLNEGRASITVSVANTGDRPVQVGSHYHFFETNAARQQGASASTSRPEPPSGSSRGRSAASAWSPSAARGVSTASRAG